MSVKKIAPHPARLLVRAPHLKQTSAGVRRAPLFSGRQLGAGALVS
jgi:hypothetical protein